MKSVVVVGSRGMLGQQVARACSQQGHEQIGVPHEQLDITDQDAVRALLEVFKPDVVINCAGIVKSRQVDEDLMIDVNAIAPHKLSDVCDEQGIRLVQISTDCVFAGDGPHIETDKPNEPDIYGKTKALGEVVQKPHLTIRCSFIGLGPRGLLHWLQEQKGEVEGYRNVQWNGLTVQSAAGAIVDLATTEITGIRHLFGDDTNKYEVLEIANRVLDLGLGIQPVDSPVADYRLRTIVSPDPMIFPPLLWQMKGLVSC